MAESSLNVLAVIDVDVNAGRIATDALQKRLEMLIRDLQVYGALLARQRRADSAGRRPGFLARHRP